MHQISDERGQPRSILLHIKHQAAYGEHRMPRVLLQEENKAEDDEDEGESQHAISEFLLFEDFDSQDEKERSQGKEKPYRIDEIEFVPLAIGMKRFDA